MIAKLKNLLDFNDAEHIVVSFLLHIILLLSLASITTHLHNSSKNIIILSSYDENTVANDEPNLEDITTFSSDLTIKAQESSGVTEIVSQPEVMIPEHIDDVQTLNEPISSISIPQNILTETFLSTVGNNTDHQQSVGGVLDRLTPEIISLAQNRDINIVWLFDASISLSNQRKQIKDRITKILSEINDSSFATHKITHSICSFGKTLNILSKEPTDDANLIVKQIEPIALDDSGIENVFGSIISHVLS